MARRAVAEINLAAISRNIERIRGGLGKTRLCAVVKADAYGHGALPVAQAALDAGAAQLAVATAEEALELRQGGVAAEVAILVLGAVSDEELPSALAANAEIVAWDPEFVARLAGHRVGVHVKLDTGMGRLGTRSLERARAVAALLAEADGPHLVGVMTHFATSDGDLDFVTEQLDRFTPLAAELGGTGVICHAANSGGALRMAASHLDMVRCGIAIYGGDPMNRDPADFALEPALALRSYVAAVKPIAAGESAGYGRRFIAEADGWLATVPIGYGDGLRRGLTNNADVLIGGRRHPLVGTVSMDNITVWLGERGSPAPVRVGDAVTLIGRDGTEQITAEEMAERLGTINYEVLCGISRRVPRRYHRDGAPA